MFCNLDIAFNKLAIFSQNATYDQLYNTYYVIGYTYVVDKNTTGQMTEVINNGQRIM